MDFSLSKRRRKLNPLTDEKYSARLSMYTVPPQGNITTTEFYSTALDRLTILRSIYNNGIKYNRGSDMYLKTVTSEIKTHLPLRPSVLEETDNNAKTKTEERRKDHISHFLLRLAYCRTEEARKWFCDCEKELFRLRLEEHREEIYQFLVDNSLKFEEVGESEVADKQQLIRDSSQIHHNKEKITVYKVPFIEALELVKHRRVYVEAGMAYVPHTELVSILTGMFRAHLSKCLIKCARSLPAVSDDERIMSILNELTTAYNGDDFSSTKLEGQVSVSQLPAVSKTSFPPCMRNIYEVFTEQHHIKHGARLQFCLFLKGLGLSIEDVRTYFRQEFCRKMDSETYGKSGHDYMVRHLFGKEGKRSDKTPYGCMKIITGSGPSSGDCHGCPFKHMDAENLERKLSSWKIPKIHIREILGLVAGQHYQIACSKYYEVTHNKGDAAFGLNHPNQYFLESQQALGNKVNVGKQGYQSSQSSAQSSQSIPGSQSQPGNVSQSGNLGNQPGNVSQPGNLDW
ncbi:DNA primase large subunit-like isoform X2 [Bolinopsis microptera]|uniref:DNA primase large subunit-like isoform X2 n=1 Tax=Bolinopsis microptera TaxID=2820187 RepID=UPI003078ED43